MKGRILAIVGLAAFGIALLLSGGQAQASSHAVLAFDKLVAALNSGEVDTAAALFADQATAENLVQAETYRGASQIRQMLDEMQRPGRRLEVVAVAVDGDTLTARVEVSDHGIVWATETVEAVMDGDKLQSFRVVDFELQLWRIRR